MRVSQFRQALTLLMWNACLPYNQPISILWWRWILKATSSGGERPQESEGVTASGCGEMYAIGQAAVKESMNSGQAFR